MNRRMKKAMMKILLKKNQTAMKKNKLEKNQRILNKNKVKIMRKVMVMKIFTLQRKSQTKERKLEFLNIMLNGQDMMKKLILGNLKNTYKT